MIQILFITTGVNCVQHKLETVDGVCLSVIDLQKESIKSIKHPKNEMFSKYVASINPSILITYRCPYILSTESFSIAKAGAYNIHPSLLPKYPGLNPWDEFFRNKETQAGVTFHKMTDNVDAGEIILQESFIVDNNETIDSIRDKVDIIAAYLVDLFLDRVVGTTNQTVPSLP